MSFTVKLESGRLRQALQKILGPKFTEKAWSDFWLALKSDGAAIHVEHPTGELLLHYWALKDWKQGKTCAAHPRYRGKDKPTSKCEVCWHIYLVEEDKRILKLVGKLKAQQMKEQKKS